MDIHGYASCEPLKQCLVLSSFSSSLTFVTSPFYRFLFLVLISLFSSLFSTCYLCTFSYASPSLAVHKRQFYLFHQNAEGLGVCASHAEINFGSASGTKQSTTLIPASACAHETYRAHLSSASLPPRKTFCSHSTAIIVNHRARVMRCERSWQMSNDQVYIISSEMKETQTGTRVYV